jgi:lipoic acid synthetase
MIMGSLCTRRCPFCDVAHGRPLPLDREEPRHLAETIAASDLKYVVITSVDRDDLRDGGAGISSSASARCGKLSPGHAHRDPHARLPRPARPRAANPRRRPPDVMNHNLETVPRLYRQARPGSDYAHSLALLRDFKARHPRSRRSPG